MSGLVLTSTYVRCGTDVVLTVFQIMAHQKERQRPVRCDQRRGWRVAAQGGVPEPGVLDPGDQFWLEAMADAVLILSPVRGRNQHVSDFRVEYANAAAAELADERTAERLRPGGLIGSRFSAPTSPAPSMGCAIAFCGRARRSTRSATCASADTAIGSSSRCVTSPPENSRNRGFGGVRRAFALLWTGCSTRA
jgi:hypothetical protein